MKPIAGLCAGVAFVLAIVVAIIAVRPLPVTLTLAEQTMQSHLQAVESNRLTEISSGKVQEVKTWLQQYGAELPAVPDLSAKGFALIGARLERFENRLVPVLVYASGSQQVSVYHWPVHCAPALPACTSAMGRYYLINWSDTEIQFYAIADIPMEQLETFAKVMRGNTRNK